MLYCNLQCLRAKAHRKRIREPDKAPSTNTVRTPQRKHCLGNYPIQDRRWGAHRHFPQATEEARLRDKGKENDACDRERRKDTGKAMQVEK